MNLIPKKYKIIFWLATGLLFLFEGVMPAVSYNMQITIDSFRNLGYPDYFRFMLILAKVLGALALIIPKVSPRIKEWAYAGFTFNFIAAAWSNTAIFGFGFDTTIFPIIFLAVLWISYMSYHKVWGDPFAKKA